MGVRPRRWWWEAVAAPGQSLWSPGIPFCAPEEGALGSAWLSGGGRCPQGVETSMSDCCQPSSHAPGDEVSPRVMSLGRSGTPGLGERRHPARTGRTASSATTSLLAYGRVARELLMPTAGMGARSCWSLGAPHNTCLLSSPVILAAWFCLDTSYSWGDSSWTRGKFFTVRTASHWDNLPREVADSPTLDTLKIQLDRALGHLV